METEKEILDKWKKAKEKIDNGEVDMHEAIKKAFKEACGHETGWYIDVYSDGAIGGPRSQNTSSICDWHGIYFSCPDCMPVASIEGWSITDIEGIHDYHTNEEGKDIEKDGMVWNENSNEWVDEEELLDDLCSDFAQSLLSGEYSDLPPDEQIDQYIEELEEKTEREETEKEIYAEIEEEHKGDLIV